MTSDMLLHVMSGIQGTYSSIVTHYYIHSSKHTQLSRCFGCRLLSNSKAIDPLSVLLVSLVRDAMNREKLSK